MTLTKLTPLLLAALGGLCSELSGVINFALEGMMLAGAFGAVWGCHASGSPWIGLATGAGCGMLVAFLHAFACLRLRANQIVSSIALNLLAAGLTGMLLNEIFHVYGTTPLVATLPKLSTLTLLQPLIGQAASASFARLSVLVPATLAITAVAMVVLRHTVVGLRIRACGENPEAAEAAGLITKRIRFLAVVTSGALAGTAGAYLSIGLLSGFVETMTQGRGYLAIAALILGRWKPVGILLAATLFGFSEALSESLAVAWPQFPSQLFLALPYAICLLVLTGSVGKALPPSGLGR
jgi:general nucleoside transport system permease protein